MNNLLITSGGAAVVASLFIQYLKKSHWFTFLSTEAHSQTTNMVFSIVVAGITSLGISFSYNASKGQLIIDGLTFTSIFSAASHWFIQWAGQHVAYKTVVVPSELQAAMVNVLKQLNENLETKK